jgi:hypothetical protein
VARRLPITIAAGALISAVLPATALAAPAGPGGSPAQGSRAGHAALVRYQQLHGYLPAVSPARYAGLKAQAAVAAGQQAGASTAPAARLATPVAGPSAKGLANTAVAPSDSTGAIGPNSYIEMINLNIGIYNRSLGLITSATLGTLTGQPNGNLSDPQVIWDPATNRFYYVVLNVATDNFQWGFSKSANPTAIPSGFCNYTANFGFGTSLPDYPKLGDTRHSLLIGANVFNSSGAFSGSDVSWITKPSGTGTITTCPSAGSFTTGKSGFLNSASGGQSFTPEPGVQADPSTTGWIAGIPARLPASSLDIFKVTENTNGTPNIPTTSTSVPVSSYNVPPNAPQSGSSFALDTLDGRLMHAVTAVDPLRGGTALWTSNSVAGGAGAQVRWYEINVASHSLYQSGTATSSSLYVFNPASSPDRAVVSGGTAAFGADMVLGFTTSSSSAFPADQMISKIGNSTQSGFVLVHASSGNDQGFDCVQLGFCRWGDYSGATPDPAASQSGATGQVWLTQMYSTGGGQSTSHAEWGTWNWATKP